MQPPFYRRMKPACIHSGAPALVMRAHLILRQRKFTEYVTRLHSDVVDRHATVFGRASTSLYDDLMKASRQRSKHPVPRGTVCPVARRQVFRPSLFIDDDDAYHRFVDNSRRLQQIVQLQTHVGRVHVRRS